MMAQLNWTTCEASFEFEREKCLKILAAGKSDDTGDYDNVLNARQWEEILTYD